MADDGSIANVTMPGLNCLQRSVGPIVGLGADLKRITGDRNITITVVGNTGNVTINVGMPSTPAAPAAAPQDLDKARDVVTTRKLSEMTADAIEDGTEDGKMTDAAVEDDSRKRKALSESGPLPTRPASPCPALGAIAGLFVRSHHHDGELVTNLRKPSPFDCLIGSNFSRSSPPSVPEAIPERRKNNLLYQ